MKYLFAIIVVIGTLGLFVAPGLTEDPLHPIPAPAGPGGPIQHVTINFVHDTSSDMALNTNITFDECSTPVPDAVFPYYSPELNQTCDISHVLVQLEGDIEGDNPGLSDVYCFNSTNWFEATKAHVELMGILIGTLTETDEPINMLGRMILDIVLPPAEDRFSVPHQMKGNWVFQKGVGTHYGAFRVEGEVTFEDGRFVGRGTYKGWIRTYP